MGVYQRYFAFPQRSVYLPPVPPEYLLPGKGTAFNLGTIKTGRWRIEIGNGCFFYDPALKNSLSLLAKSSYSSAGLYCSPTNFKYYTITYYSTGIGILSPMRITEVWGNLGIVKA